jgi:YidC/Oxa1 family membrane protein insertase
MMALQQAEGFNPISGCLPMFLQIPVFIALFHVLKHMSNSIGLDLHSGNRALTLYGFTAQQTYDASHAKLFKAPLAASLHESGSKILTIHGDVTSTRIVIAVLVVISAAATFITQRAVVQGTPTPAEGQAALIQKLMLVGIPISVVFSGLFFPLGVLLYWFTSNLWTMGQQFYIHRIHPHQTPSAKSGANHPSPTSGSLAPRVGVKPHNRKRPSRIATDPSSAAPTQPGQASATRDVTDARAEHTRDALRPPPTKQAIAPRRKRR